MRNCWECGSVLERRTATHEAPYRYEMSGLKNVYLCGITTLWCPKCKTVSPVIPRLPELHRVISEALASKVGPLIGDEVRFLRKSAGVKASEFASRLGLSPEHLSRVENGKADLSDTADKLVRLTAIAALEQLNDQLVKEISARRAAHLHAMNERRARREFRLRAGVWTNEAA